MRLLPSIRRARAPLTACTTVLAINLAAGCNTRNPYEVSKERQQQGSAPAPAPAPEPTPQRPPHLLESATEARPIVGAPGRGRKIDLAAARRSQSVIMRANDPIFPTRLDAVFDGDVKTLARTEDVNPLILTLEFPKPITLQAVRLFPSYSSYDWALEAAEGQAPLVIRYAPAEVWSGIELTQPVTTKLIRVHVQRLERDNFVHVNELELWGQPASETTRR